MDEREGFSGFWLDNTGHACSYELMTAAAKARALKRSATWRLEAVDSFAEAEAQTGAHWHAATSAERFEAAARVRYIVYGKAAATARLQRVLEVVSPA